MREHYLLDMLLSITAFVHQKLNMENGNNFLICDERFLLQSSIGIIDEYHELDDEKDELKKLAELGDVLFYLNLGVVTMRARYKIEKMDKTIEVVMNKEPREDTKYYIREFLSLSKKIAFQGRRDIIDKAFIVLLMIVNSIEINFTKEECELAIALMKWKLNKRYGSQFTPEKSKERKV